jgi:hypothetical protein
MQSLWPDTFVEEANLPFQISALRKALGEDGAAWIETLPKHGYRFTAPVQRIDGGQPTPLALGKPVRRFLPWLIAAAAVLFAAAMFVRQTASSSKKELILVPLPAFREVKTKPHSHQMATRWRFPGMVRTSAIMISGSKRSGTNRGCSLRAIRRKIIARHGLRMAGRSHF